MIVHAARTAPDLHQEYSPYKAKSFTYKHNLHSMDLPGEDTFTPTGRDLIPRSKRHSTEPRVRSVGKTWHFNRKIYHKHEQMK